MRRAVLASVIALAIGGSSVAASLPSQAAVISKTVQDAENKEILDYMDRYPDDLVGLDKLTRKYTGEGVRVQFSDGQGTLNAAQAQASIKKWKSTPAKISSTGVRAYGLAPDTFRVWLVVSPLAGPPSQYRYNGRWDFKDSFAGQAAPTDIASISFNMPSCMRMVGHSISTYSVTGTDTKLGYLKAANTGAKAPIWAIADRTSGFQNLADHGAAGVTVQKYCSGAITVGADFIYEFNQGGGITGISATYGILTVSYSGQSVPPMQKGTNPNYTDF